MISSVQGCSRFFLAKQKFASLVQKRSLASKRIPNNEQDRPNGKPKAPGRSEEVPSRYARDQMNEAGRQICFWKEVEVFWVKKTVGFDGFYSGFIGVYSGFIVGASCFEEIPCASMISTFLWPAIQQLFAIPKKGHAKFTEEIYEEERKEEKNCKLPWCLWNSFTSFPLITDSVTYFFPKHFPLATTSAICQLLRWNGNSTRNAWRRLWPHERTEIWETGGGGRGVVERVRWY